MDQEEEILAQKIMDNPADDASSENPDATPSEGVDETPKEETASDRLVEKLKAEKKAKGKKQRKYIIILAIVGLFSYGVWWLFKPFKAHPNYGVCRTYLELIIPYPHSLYVSEVNMLHTGTMQIWFTHTDAFGEFRMEEFRCKLEVSPETNQLQLTSASIGEKVFFGEETLRGWNAALPYFAVNPVVYNYPMPLPDSLGQLHFQFDNFRKVVLDKTK